MKPNPNFNSLNYLFKESKHSVELTHFLINFLFDLLTIYQRIKPDKKAFTDAEISTIQEISKRTNPPEWLENNPEWLENNLFEFFSAVYILMEQGLEEGSKLEVKKITNSIKIDILIRKFFKTFESETLTACEKKEMDELRMLFGCANHYNEEWINSIRNHLNKLENGTLKFRPEYIHFIREYLSYITFEKTS